MTSLRRRKWILTAKWAVYFLLLLVAATLQTVPGFLVLGDMRPIFILPLCLAVATYEGEFAGALFGAVGGLLWDFTSGRVAGLLALGLLVVCFFVSILMQLYLRGNATNFVLINAASAALVVGVDFLFYYLMPGYAARGLHFLAVAVPTVVFTAALSPLALYAVRAVFNWLTVEE